MRRAEADQPALEGRQLRVLCRRPVGQAAQGLHPRLGCVDLGLRRLQVGVDRRLELRLAALDGRRHGDELLGQRVRDGGRAGRIGVLGDDGQERAVQRRVGPDQLQELVGGHAEAELRDHGLEDRPRRGDRGVRRGQSLRDEELVVVGVHRRERLADDEPRLRLVDLRQQAGDHERHAGGEHDDSRRGAGAMPERWQSGAWGPPVSLSAPNRGALRAMAMVACDVDGVDHRSRRSGSSTRPIRPPLARIVPRAPLRQVDRAGRGRRKVRFATGDARS